jgi:hypothetical protein
MLNSFLLRCLLLLRVDVTVCIVDVHRQVCVVTVHVYFFTPSHKGHGEVFSLFFNTNHTEYTNFISVYLFRVFVRKKVFSEQLLRLTVTNYQKIFQTKILYRFIILIFTKPPPRFPQKTITSFIQSKSQDLSNVWR